MFLRKAISPNEVMLEIHGPLSGETTNEFHKHLQDLSGEKSATVTLDLSDVSTINSSSRQTSLTRTADFSWCLNSVARLGT